jgi:hypothetical protein
MKLNIHKIFHQFLQHHDSPQECSSIKCSLFALVYFKKSVAFFLVYFIKSVAFFLYIQKWPELL